MTTASKCLVADSDGAPLVLVAIFLNDGEVKLRSRSCNLALDKVRNIVGNRTRHGLSWGLLLKYILVERLGCLRYIVHECLSCQSGTGETGGDMLEKARVQSLKVGFVAILTKRSVSPR